MTNKDEVKKKERTEKVKNTTHTKNKRTFIDKKYSWRGVFENVTYSSGPGDNIYIFG